MAPVLFPIVIVLTAAPVPILIASAEASDPILIAVPPERIVAEPFKEDSPVTVKVELALSVVKAPAAGVPPPDAGGAAKTAAKLEGVKNNATEGVDAVPATASTSVANCPIPATVSVDTGAPAIARASAYTFVATGWLLSVSKTVP